MTEKLTHSNAELERFAYIVSHDLKEPLRAITGFSSLLQRRLADRLDEDSSQYLEYIVDGARTMQKMIDGLLDYSRAGAPVEEPQAVEMDDLFARLLDRFEPIIAAQKATVSSEPLPVVWGDSTRLLQLLHNLLDNALKFHGDQPAQVRVMADEVGPAWRIQMNDEGIGIEPRQQQRIFDMFQRPHGRQDYTGLGVGLPVSKRIVESHGGRLWVESAPGQGACFSFTLPKSESVIAASD